MPTPLQIHQQAFVLDSHCDTPLMLLRHNSHIGQRLQTGHVDFPRMKEGGVNASFFAVYVSNQWEPDASTTQALSLLSRIFDTLEQESDTAALATTPAQARALKAQGKIAVFIGMENGSPIQEDLSLLRLFYRMGVRYLTLTHAGNNAICDSCSTVQKRWNGVSPFGRQVIAEMNRLGMLIDVAHISDQAFYDVLRYSTQPVVSTHSCCRALCDVPRNMTDAMIRDLAAQGGVIQVNFYPGFLDKDYADNVKPFLDRFIEDPSPEATAALMSVPRPSYERVVDHIDHIVQLVGPEHVGIGSDFDGIDMCPEGMEDISKMYRITEALCARGYTPQHIEGILGGNFLRIMEQVQAV